MRAGYPMQTVAIDIMGPFPCSKRGNKYILHSCIGLLYKMGGSLCNPTSRGNNSSEDPHTDNMCCCFSLPSQLHSDMGAQFESELIKKLCKSLQIRKTHTTPYHLQSDGLVERINRTIISMLATVVNDFWWRVGGPSAKSLFCL